MDRDLNDLSKNKLSGNTTLLVSKIAIPNGEVHYEVRINALYE